MSARLFVRGAELEIGGEDPQERLGKGFQTLGGKGYNSLAGFRGATVGLSLAPSLAACAADHGFSDQAHMTREFQRWWGRTPSAVLASAGLLAVATASGYP